MIDFEYLEPQVARLGVGWYVDGELRFARVIGDHAGDFADGSRKVEG